MNAEPVHKCICALQHFDNVMGEYPESKPKPPFNCTAIGARDEPVGQPKWQLNEDNSLDILDDRFQMLAVGGWRNEVLSLSALTQCSAQGHATLQL